MVSSSLPLGHKWLRELLWLLSRSFESPLSLAFKCIWASSLWKVHDVTARAPLHMMSQGTRQLSKNGSEEKQKIHISIKAKCFQSILLYITISMVCERNPSGIWCQLCLNTFPKLKIEVFITGISNRVVSHFCYVFTFTYSIFKGFFGKNRKKKTRKRTFNSIHI